MMNRQILDAIGQRLEGVYHSGEYPALDDQFCRWQAELPLKGVTILDASPVFGNTLAKYRPLIAAGAELTVGLSDLLPCDSQVVAFLRREGMRMVDVHEASAQEYDLVLDCAAAFAGVPARMGYVELTRSGVPRYEGCLKPVYLADSGRIKRIETMLGTGESFFRAMRARGYDRWQGRRIVIFGSGKVGSGIIFYALREGAEVTVVTDPATLSAELARQVKRVIALDDHAAAAEAVRGAYAVVTATGVAGAVAQCGAARAAVEGDALLANMGVDDEYGTLVPEQRVLGGKAPLNFELEEPTHLKYIDATLALHNEGAVWLCGHADAEGLHLPDDATEEYLIRVSCERGVAGAEIAAIL